MSDPKPSAAERIAQSTARREAMKAAEAAAFEEQRATDLEAIEVLEQEHGYGRVICVDLKGWKSGESATTLVGVRVPKSSEAVFRRYEETVSKAKAGTTAILTASHMLADACWLYPSPKDAKATYDATLELAAGIRSNLAVQIAKVVQGDMEEEKKD